MYENNNKVHTYYKCMIHESNINQEGQTTQKDNNDLQNTKMYYTET